MKYGLQCEGGHRDPRQYPDRRTAEWKVESYDKYTKCGPHLIVEYPE